MIAAILCCTILLIYSFQSSHIQATEKDASSISKSSQSLKHLIEKRKLDESVSYMRRHRKVLVIPANIPSLPQLEESQREDKYCAHIAYLFANNQRENYSLGDKSKSSVHHLSSLP